MEPLKDEVATVPPQQDEWNMLDDRFAWYDMMYESPLDAFSAHEHFQSGRSSIWASMLDLGLLSVDPAQVMQEDALMQTTYPPNDSEGNHPHPASAPPILSSAGAGARSNADGPRSQALQWDEQRWNWSDEMARMSMDSRASIILGRRKSWCQAETQHGFEVGPPIVHEAPERASSVEYQVKNVIPRRSSWSELTSNGRQKIRESISRMLSQRRIHSEDLSIENGGRGSTGDLRRASLVLRMEQRRASFVPRMATPLSSANDVNGRRASSFSLRHSHHRASIAFLAGADDTQPPKNLQFVFSRRARSAPESMLSRVRPRRPSSGAPERAPSARAPATKAELAADRLRDVPTAAVGERRKAVVSFPSSPLDAVSPVPYEHPPALAQVQEGPTYAREHPLPAPAAGSANGQAESVPASAQVAPEAVTGKKRKREPAPRKSRKRARGSLKWNDMTQKVCQKYGARAQQQKAAPLRQKPQHQQQPQQPQQQQHRQPPQHQQYPQANPQYFPQHGAPYHHPQHAHPQVGGAYPRSHAGGGEFSSYGAPAHPNPSHVEAYAQGYARAPAQHQGFIEQHPEEQHHQQGGGRAIPVYRPQAVRPDQGGHHGSHMAVENGVYHPGGAHGGPPPVATHHRHGGQSPPMQIHMQVEDRRAVHAPGAQRGRSRRSAIAGERHTRLGGDCLVSQWKNPVYKL